MTTVTSSVFNLNHLNRQAQSHGQEDPNDKFDAIPDLGSGNESEKESDQELEEETVRDSEEDSGNEPAKLSNNRLYKIKNWVTKSDEEVGGLVLIYSVS